MKDDWLILTKNIPFADLVQEGVRDLTGSTGNNDFDWFWLYLENNSWLKIYVDIILNSNAAVYVCKFGNKCFSINIINHEFPRLRNAQN